MKENRYWLICCCLFLSGCGETWEGFVYPNKHDLTAHINIGSYKSLEECRASALAILQNASSIERGDYECGLNCETNDDLGDIKICKETLR